MIFEKGGNVWVNFKDLRREITPTRFSLGLTTFLIAATGPLVVLLTDSASAKFSFETTVSWIFINYLTSAIFMVLLSLYYRQPIIMAWSIPGAALAGEALSHNSLSDVQGAYVVTALIMVGLGITGTMRRIVNLIPLPVLMGMVCGVLLPYGIAIFTSLYSIPEITIPVLGVYFLLLAFPTIGKRFPPVLAAIIVALIIASFTGTTRWMALELKPGNLSFNLPSFNFVTILELSFPLLIAALSLGDAQGYAILTSQGYVSPINSMTTSSGLVSLINALFGGHSGCIAGTLQGIVAGPEAGKKEGRYAGVVSQSFFWLALAIFAPVAASISRVLVQKALIPMLGGIALIGVIMSALQQAFSGKFKIGAFFAFLITLSNIKFANIGSAFWGLAAGLILAYCFDMQDFKKEAPLD